MLRPCSTIPLSIILTIGSALTAEQTTWRMEDGSRTIVTHGKDIWGNNVNTVNRYEPGEPTTNESLAAAAVFVAGIAVIGIYNWWNTEASPLPQSAAIVPKLQPRSATPTTQNESAKASEWPTPSREDLKNLLSSLGPLIKQATTADLTARIKWATDELNSTKFANDQLSAEFLVELRRMEMLELDERKSKPADKEVTTERKLNDFIVKCRGKFPDYIFWRPKDFSFMTLAEREDVQAEIMAGKRKVEEQIKTKEGRLYFGNTKGGLPHGFGVIYDDINVYEVGFYYYGNFVLQAKSMGMP